MKIEKHNGHGMQLLVNLHPLEALSLARKLVETAEHVGNTDVNHYVSIPCEFEDDNDRWVKTDFDIVVGDNIHADCLPTYPCGEPVGEQGFIPAGPCDLQEEHEGPCYRRTAKPEYK